MGMSIAGCDQMRFSLTHFLDGCALFFVWRPLAHDPVDLRLLFRHMRQLVLIMLPVLGDARRFLGLVARDTALHRRGQSLSGD